ncbi:MAG: Gldg family protein [Gammaproteobacteria bacterium]|nr:Gldg family protein [Gammaproteobacteria bacterium]
MNRKLISIAGLLLLAVFFVLFVLVHNQLPNMRWDLTEHKLYTLSEGSKNILKSIDEPLKLYFFYSNTASQNFPAIRNYADRVLEFLATLSRESKGKLILERIDPEPFSEAEDKASEFGLQAIPVNESGTAIYFGLAARNAVGGTETIPFFQPDKELFLEYEVSKLIYNLSQPHKKVLGVLSTIPLQGGANPLTQQPTDPLFVMEQLKTLFDVREISSEATQIEPEISVLMVVHPRNLSQETLYAIDQYVLRGGKLLAFVDPLAENASSGFGSIVYEPTANKTSSMEPLFKAWGIRLVPEQVLADSISALTVRTSPESKPIRHLTVLSLRRTSLNASQPITQPLSNIHVQSAGVLEKLEGSSLEFIPLISSSQESMLIKPEKVELSKSDPGTLLDGFESTQQSYTIAVRLHGKVKSAFSGEALAKKNPLLPHIMESQEPANIIVVADTDMLADYLWVRVQNFLGYRIPSFIAHNGDFVVNAVDVLSGSNDLINLRSRGTYTRPFERVLALQGVAEEKFRTKEEELKTKLKETEAKLLELQKNREASTHLVLSEEQKQALLTFRAEKTKIRKELREVQHALNKDIEHLASVLKVLNMSIVPILILIFAFLMRFVRTRRLQKIWQGGKPLSCVKNTSLS